MNFINAKDVKTRKPHRCFGCLREFPAGSMLERITHADGGRIFSAYWCPVCKEVWNSGDYDSDSEISEGTLKTEDPAWEQIRAKLEDKHAP